MNPQDFRNKLTVVALTGLTFISAACGQGTIKQPDLSQVTIMADSLAKEVLAAQLTPGLTIAVGLEGKILFSKGYGLANIEEKVPANPETIFGITSITKQFTAATILKLMERGELSLDDSVGKYLPEFSLQGHDVTIGHLLNHTSGTPSMRSTSAIQDKNWFSKDLSFEEMLTYFGNEPFEFEPGQKHAYNNFAYYLLGEIITRITGMPWDIYMEKEIFEPFGLNSTTTCDAGRIANPGATTYLKGQNGFVVAPRMSKKILGASGALCSTVKDLILWNEVLHSGKFISPSSLKLMKSPTILSGGDTINEGFGVYLEELDGRTKISHGGTLPWGAFLSYYPESGLSIAVLTNSARVGRETAEKIEVSLARTALGIEARGIRLDPKEYQKYTGIYVLRLGKQERELKIFQVGQNLMGQLQGQQATQLLYQDNHLFSLVVDPDIKLQFKVEQAQAESVVLHQAGREIAGSRKTTAAE